ncbi:MAG: DMT family transporter [Ruminococcaceae bacterium]|nr:DMT family transporter [Oscillospiraceae bacterium]
MSKQKKADLLLVMVTGFWGISYLLADMCLEHMPPMNLNAFRFLLAFFVLGGIYHRRMRNISRSTLKYAVLVGLCLVVVYICCSYGLLYTSISNAGFICALPVVTTPVLEFLISRQKPSPRLGVALVLCTIGLALLTLNEQFRPALGDIICLGVAVFYAIDLVITDRAVRKPDVDPLQMGILQLGVVGVVTLILSFLLEKPILPPTPGIWAAALFLGIFCSGVAFVVQTVQQQYTSASHVGLIFTLEPLFSAFVAYLFANEVLGVRGYIGAALMMFSLLLMELDWSSLWNKLKKKG